MYIYKSKLNEKVTEKYIINELSVTNWKDSVGIKDKYSRI